MSELASFNESNVNWEPLPGPDGLPADHIGMSILNIDDRANIVDVLFKFDAGAKIVMHRHTSVFNTFVVKGEHHIYSPDGELTEVRPLPELTDVGSPARNPIRKEAAVKTS